MPNRKSSKVKDNNFFAYILGSAFVIGLGYYVLNFFATGDHTPDERTLFIIGGCVLMTIGGVVMTVKIREKYFPKKKKKKVKPVFLKDQNKKEQS
jgi:xanthine/uracil permease